MCQKYDRVQVPHKLYHITDHKSSTAYTATPVFFFKRKFYPLASPFIIIPSPQNGVHGIHNRLLTASLCVNVAMAATGVTSVLNSNNDAITIKCFFVFRSKAVFFNRNSGLIEIYKPSTAGTIVSIMNSLIIVVMLSI